MALIDRPAVTLELDDIQATVLRYRPEPYYGTHVLLSVGDARAGREFLQRLAPHVDSAAEWWQPGRPWIAVAITYSGLEALGLPEVSLRASPRPSAWAWPHALTSSATTARTRPRTGRPRSPAGGSTSA